MTVVTARGQRALEEYSMDCIALDVLNLHIIDTICGEDIDRLRVLVVLQWLELLVVASYVPDAARSGCRGSD